MIEHTVRVMPKKRQVEDLIEKRKKIGELLKLDKVPLHVLAWKEPRLELGDGDCYPVIDVLERIAERLVGINTMVGVKPLKKPGRPKKSE